MTGPNTENVQADQIALTHSGAVAFRQKQNRILYLVVSSSKNADWVLPKGHIEPGETPEVAALRELKEEAGVIGEILESVAIQHFQKSTEDVVVQYFLVCELSSTLATEKRTLRWEDFEGASQLLTFANARQALQAAAAALRRLEHTE
jgi:8-oxo-dGTP pyrophosphatase MutT (NUDIX family)